MQYIILSCLLSVSTIVPLPVDALLIAWCIFNCREKDGLSVKILLCMWLASTLNPLAYTVLGLSLFKIPIFLMFTFFIILTQCYYNRMHKQTMWVILFLLYLIVAALSNSNYSDVAIFKAILFCSGIITINYWLSRTSWVYNIEIIRGFFRATCIASIIIFILGYGYTRNATGFAGILNHPQVFGTFSAICLMVELAFLFLKREQFSNNKICSLSFISIFLIFVFMSESRTAFISTIISIFIVLVILLFTRFKSLMISKRFCFVLLATLLFSAFNFNEISERVEYTMTKSGRVSGTIIDGLEDSRLKFAYASFKNFQENPIFGIGFQVSNGKFGHYPMEVERDGLTGLPIKASVEKGVFYAAIFEEVGAIGAFIFLIYIASIVIQVYKNSVILILPLSTVLLSNFGESTLFSLGANGLLLWIIICSISIKGEHNG